MGEIISVKQVRKTYQIGDELIEAEVDLHAGDAEGLREEVLGVDAGLVEAGAGEALAGPLQQLGDGPELLSRGTGLGGHAGAQCSG